MQTSSRDSNGWLRQRCSRCHGRGEDFPFPCLRCDGEGWELSKDTITIRIPPGVLDGTLFRYALQSLGIKNLWPLPSQVSKRGASRTRTNVSTIILVPKVVENGDIPVLAAVGQSVGRINDIPSVSELIDRIVSEAKEVLGASLGRTMA